MRVAVGMPLGEARGGAERLLRTLVRHSSLELHVALTQPGPLLDQLRADGAASVVAWDFGRFRQAGRAAGATRAAARWLRGLEPDIVLSWLPAAHVRLAPAVGIAGRPAAWWQHHSGEGERGLVQAATLAPARGIVCTSAAVAEHQARLRPRRRLLVCEPGIEAPAAVATRTAAGPPTVGICGRLVPWKGQDRFLDALRLLRAEGREVRGMIIGDESHGLAPGYGAALRERAAGLDVAFTGHVDDPLPLIAGCDVLVNASLEEPFGMTLVEALALGVPTVAVDRGGPREILAHGAAGVLLRDGSPPALAAGIGRVLDDAGLRERIVAAGQERYLERYTAEAFAERADAAVRSLAP